MAHFLQVESEFKSFCELLKSENARSYLEIGSFSGGSIEYVARYLPVGSLIVSIDKPWKLAKAERLRLVLDNLKRRGYDTHLYLGDSTDANMIRKAAKWGPYDAVFIDGNHQLEYVKSDWENYGPLGRIVGFHDIARDLPVDEHGGPHQVASFWNGFKSEHRHAEFISDGSRVGAKKGSYGIGVIWRQ